MMIVFIINLPVSQRVPVEERPYRTGKTRCSKNHVEQNLKHVYPVHLTSFLIIKIQTDLSNSLLF